MKIELTDRTVMNVLSNELFNLQQRLKELDKDEKIPASVKIYEWSYLEKKEGYIIAQMAMLKQLITPSEN